jgi:hypothetical protein
MKKILTTAILLLMTTSLMAETWPTLDQYVKMCDLVVLCETEIVDSKPIFRVTDKKLAP